MNSYFISVAMTTFNGEQYILDQLNSLYYQTRKIDEVIICDDGSTDRTEEIITNFLLEKKLSSKWKFKKNTSNKGPMKNFAECAKLCKGDIIFFCDQDDIWNENKIDVMEKVFLNHDDALAVCCGQQYMNKNGKVLIGKGKYISNNICKKISISEQVRDMYSSGLCLAIKKELINDVFLLVTLDDLTYDITSGLLAAARNGLYRIEKPLVNRRIHDNNASSPPMKLFDRIRDNHRYIDGRILQLNHLKALSNKYEIYLSEKEKLYLKNRIQMDEDNLYYLQNKDTLHLIVQCFKKNPMANKKIYITNVIMAIGVRKADRC